MIEKDLVWEELGLMSLLEEQNRSMEASLQKKLTKGKDDALIKHRNMVKKPAYSVLMDRYQSKPHKPKTIEMSKLSRLADPILGRLSRLDKLNLDQSILSPNEEQSKVIVKEGYLGQFSRNRNEDNQESTFLTSTRSRSQSPASSSAQKFNKSKPKVDDGTFLTDLEQSNDEGSPIKNKIVFNKQVTKNGFSTLIRNRVQSQNKVNKILKSNVIQNPKKSFEAKLNQRNKSRFPGKMDTIKEEGSTVSKKKPPYRDPLTKKVRKIVSSGYGKPVQRFSNLKPPPVYNPKPKIDDSSVPKKGPRMNQPLESQVKQREIRRPLSIVRESRSAEGTKTNEISMDDINQAIEEGNRKKKPAHSAPSVLRAKVAQARKINESHDGSLSPSKPQKKPSIPSQSSKQPTSSSSTRSRVTSKQSSLPPKVSDTTPIQPNNMNIDELLAQAEQDEIDLQATLAKLKKYESSVIPKEAGEVYAKPDINSQLYRHAERLGKYFQNAEEKLKGYQSLKDQLL